MASLPPGYSVVSVDRDGIILKCPGGGRCYRHELELELDDQDDTPETDAPEEVVEEEEEDADSEE